MDLSEIVLWHNLEHTLPPPPISLKPFLFSLYVLFDEKLTTNYWKKTITHIENHRVVYFAGINRTALYEIKLLQELRHPNIIGVKEH